MKNFSEIYLEKNKEYFLGFENNYNLKKKLIIKEKFAFARPPTGGMNSSRGGGTCPECDTGEESWGSPRGIAGCGCRKILTPQEQIAVPNLTVVVLNHTVQAKAHLPLVLVALEDHQVVLEEEIKK